MQGWATFKGVRADVRGVSRLGLVAVTGELLVSGVHNLEYRDGSHPDSQSPLMFGEVSFLDLDRFWLTRTSTFEAIDETLRCPGC